MGLGSAIRDTRSGKNLFRIPDPGVKKAPDPGSATLPTMMKKYALTAHITDFLADMMVSLIPTPS
jgi:hypothetical protein